MSCPHPDMDCEDCPELTCSRHPGHSKPAAAALEICATCPHQRLARLVADFVRMVAEEDAYQTGDAESDYWTALQERRAGA